MTTKDPLPSRFREVPRGDELDQLSDAFDVSHLIAFRFRPEDDGSACSAPVEHFELYVLIHGDEPNVMLRAIAPDLLRREDDTKDGSNSGIRKALNTATTLRFVRLTLGISRGAQDLLRADGCMPC